MMNTPRPERAFVGISALVFVASAAVTIAWCGSMSAMRGMEMPGGWTMSMAWMRMPGRSWSEATGAFIGMWTVMMIAMMAPVLVPMLARYWRAAMRAAGRRVDQLTVIVAVAYFFVWSALGAVAFPAGAMLAELMMRLPEMSRWAPVAASAVVGIAGLVQFTAWKRHQLDCCRRLADCDDVIVVSPSAAWRHGARLGVHCVRCCAGLTAVLLVIGVMNVGAMAAVAAAIAAERLLPVGERVARGIGWALVAIALLMISGWPWAP
jgi:predicted metal-binding membrane protein